jgi:hypothetical protein
MSAAVADEKETDFGRLRMASNCCQVVEVTGISAARKKAKMSAESGHLGNRL